MSDLQGMKWKFPPLRGILYSHHTRFCLIHNCQYLSLLTREGNDCCHSVINNVLVVWLSPQCKCSISTKIMLFSWFGLKMNAHSWLRARPSTFPLLQLWKFYSTEVMISV